MKQSWYAELEHEHGEQLLLLERIEVAVRELDLARARDLVAELDRKLAEHLAYEEEVLRERWCDACCPRRWTPSTSWSASTWASSRG